MDEPFDIETASPDIDPEMRDLLKAHHEAIVRELTNARDDVKHTVAQLREDQRVDMERISARQAAHEERTRKIERRLDFLNAIHAIGAGALAWIATRVFGGE